MQKLQYSAKIDKHLLNVYFMDIVDICNIYYIYNSGSFLAAFYEDWPFCDTGSRQLYIKISAEIWRKLGRLYIINFGINNKYNIYIKRVINKSLKSGLNIANKQIKEISTD